MNRQAVVVIHGIGEQRPMDTIRGFVSAVLPEPEDDSEQYWSKPDKLSQLFELRKLQSRGRSKADFYEYYWAYQVEGSNIRHVVSWFKDLMFRAPKNVPSGLKFLWYSSWILTFGLLITSTTSIRIRFFGGYASANYLDLKVFAIVLVLSVLNYYAVHYIGDAARYLSPNPENIKLRQRVRAEGVRLLEELSHRRYDRIILVGHSLGSVIGYDIINLLWERQHNTYDQNLFATHLYEGKDPQEILNNELYIKASKLVGGTYASVLDFQKTQFECWKEQKSLGNPWRISDFITLGSPLAHAMLLMAKGRDEFEERKRQREIPTCPPQKDEVGFTHNSFTPFELADRRKYTPKILHYSAAFALTRWTNLYFPAWLGIFGDIVGGPLRGVLGKGILDTPVRLFSWKRFTILSHVKYWSKEALGDKKKKAKLGNHSLNALIRTLSLESLRRSG